MASEVNRVCQCERDEKDKVNTKHVIALPPRSVVPDESDDVQLSMS